MWWTSPTAGTRSRSSSARTAAVHQTAGARDRRATDGGPRTRRRKYCTRGPRPRRRTTERPPRGRRRGSILHPRKKKAAVGRSDRLAHGRAPRGWPGSGPAGTGSAVCSAREACHWCSRVLDGDPASLLDLGHMARHEPRDPVLVAGARYAGDLWGSLAVVVTGWLAGAPSVAPRDLAIGAYCSRARRRNALDGAAAGTPLSPVAGRRPSWIGDLASSDRASWLRSRTHPHEHVRFHYAHPHHPRRGARLA